MKKKYVAFARVSSREQEREGFSLDVQEKAFDTYVKKNRGEIIKSFRISETASKAEQRTQFRSMIDYVKKHHTKIDAVLFYKVDRAARNLKDLVELEDLESKYGVEFVSVSQPMGNDPAGRMQRRTLATMAAFFTEQHALDVREGIAQRVACGLPPSRASFGYKNVRIDKRSIVVVDTVNAAKVKRIFELFAYHCVSVADLAKRLAEEGIVYCDSKPRFSERTLYKILNDRMYIGEVKHRGEWHPGSHQPIIDRPTWDRAQVLLGQKVYRSHDMLFAGELIVCGHCGHPITGEVKEKFTRAGRTEYRYYRCTQYHKGSHPRIRLTEAELDTQVLDMLESAESRSFGLESWMAKVVQSRTTESVQVTKDREKELRRQLSSIEPEKDQLLNLRLAGRISDADFDKKQSELQHRHDRLSGLLDKCAVRKAEATEVSDEASRIFAAVKNLWPSAPYLVKRRVLEIVFQSLVLHGRTLLPSKRTPLELFLAG